MSFARSNTNKALVTGIAYMDTREINPNLIDVSRETGFDDLMMLIKRYKETKQPDYHHFVNEDVLQVVTFDTAGVAGSGTNTLTVTVTSTGFLRVDQKLLFKNGKMGKINSAITTAGGKDSFSIVSVDGSNLTAAAGDIVTVSGITVGEKSKSVDVINYGQTKYFNQLETLRDKTSITDIQLSATVEIGDGHYAHIQAIEQAKSFKLQLSATLTAGVKSVNTYGTSSASLTDKNGNSTQTTGGFVNEINSYGVLDTVITPGTVVNADVDALCDSLTAVKAPASYLILSPDKAWRQWDNYFKNLGSSGVVSARLNMDGQEVNYNVEKFTKGKFNFEFGKLDILDHPQLYNFTGASNVGKCVYGMPKDKVKADAGPSGGSSSYEPRIGVRYFKNQNAGKNMGTEYVMETYDGRLAPNPTGDENALICHISTQQGMECLGTRQMFRQIVTA